MHTAHIMLVKAEDHDDAISRVQIELTPEEGQHFASWSDWSLVGDEGFGNSRYAFEKEENKYSLSLAEEPEMFMETLDKFIGYRVRETELLKSRIEGVELSSLKAEVDDIDFSESAKAYDVLKFVELVCGHYTYDSAFYDLQNHTTHLKYFRDSVANGETDWFIVLVDFHF